MIPNPYGGPGGSGPSKGLEIPSWVGPALVAGGSAAVGYIGNERTNLANARQARDQMAFQERMANTEWQRGVADMKAAGLNPALAYEKGGASSPGGAMAQMTDSMAKGASSALEVKALQSRLASEQVQRVATAAQADQSAASAEQSRAQARTIEMTRDLVAANLLEDQYLKQANSRESNIRGTDLFNRSPWMTRLLEEELTQGRPLLREVDRKRSQLFSSNAREVDQRIELSERMTPDQWSAWIQRNLLPFTPLR